ncbi:unnamed protein product [Urochloa decumbens]|uniref:Uncharacterized protein n=1 Tax=Urochloa decumbens TaxID=240449 RepID=A0ABC9BZU4_9POAL
MAAQLSVSTGVLEPLLSKLTKLLEEQYDMLRGVSKQIKFLRDELKAMSIKIQLLADAEDLSDHMKNWRDHIRELAYDIEDCIDGFMARLDREHGGPTGTLGLFHKFKKLISRHEIANEIELLKARAIEASERHKRYNFVEQASNSTRSSAVDPRLPALYVEIDELVGIDGPKKHIIEWLTRETEVPTSEERKVTVLSIVGCGGLGKTTLANQVYLKVKGQFDCAAFVSVSQNPDVKKILRDIVKEVDIKGNILDHDEKQLIDKLRKHLRDKRYLVVIDDIWDSKPWEIIKLALLNKKYESRVIATTRSTTVASVLSSQGGNVYHMRSLSSKDSKRLLFKRAFGSETISCTHLGSVPDEILKKCDGLPLAIVTISSMLADQHARSEWDRVLDGIGFALAKNPDAENMTTILSMSYFDIPYHLRTCLLYLSVFPEDYHIEKQCLINRWIAEGFIQEEGGQTKYEIGEGYFNDLINRSMIQPIDVKYGQAKACRVHDIILDYIKCKAAEENFVISLDAARHVNNSHFKVRRFSVNNSNDQHVTLWTSRVLSMVRSVTIFGYPVKTSLLPFTVLRVLDLGHCRKMDDHHLTSIERLFLLKYLRLSSSLITKLPEKVGELQYLQTLDV